MKKIKILSMRYIGIYFLLFALVCGIATFVENAHSTEIAKAAVYNTKWFELILLIAGLSLLYNIKIFKLYSLKKLPIGIFHLGFFIMIIGAGITRYVGQEGKVHIREGENVDYYLQNNKAGIEAKTLPFSITLEDFEVDYYPGSTNASEYRSKVVLFEKGKIVMDYEIYMNHILKYRGYRFFQSSYDKDFRGTILTVNHDSWGMRVTYFGYLCLLIGMVGSLFAKGSRFQGLLRELKQHQMSLAILVLLALPLISNAAPTIDKNISQEFGEMWMSNGKGRIQPMHTHNLNLLKKISHERSYEGLNADEVILGILTSPEAWKDEPIILVDQSVHEILKTNSEYLAYNQFFDKTGRYLLMKEAQEASSKSLNERNKTNKSLLNITERVSVFKMIIEGDFMTIYPEANDWLSPNEIRESDDKDIVRINKALLYALTSRNSEELRASFKLIEGIQKAKAKSHIPSDRHRAVEIANSKLNIFARLAPYYATIAILLLILIIIAIVKQEKPKAITFFKWTLYIGFILQTLGIIMRWYISGRAPMGNSYESMIIVSWASILGGLIFVKKSPITLAISTILASATLLVAHINSMNPEITALVPVLNSSWLSSHVASITASYGLLCISALLGLFSITLAAFGKRQFTKEITELTIISKLLMIIGLYLMTIGCFIGAVWANESWGNYWSWDPKETWCLITIVIYSFIIHMHHAPQLASNVVYNILSTWAMSSILMTYFGVNYFLGGMHSYAGGEAPNIPSWSYGLLIILVFISIKAYYNERKSN